ETMADVYIGVGSNVEPERHLRNAVATLAERFGALRCSDAYSSPAYGFSGADFLNMVVGCSTAAEPDGVEQVLHDIEYEGGRLRRGPRFASRTLDLDLLLYGAMVDARRRVPRDDVCRYPFVLGPLADIAPDLRHPLTGRRIADEWAGMRRRAECRLKRVGPLEGLR
ncbi:MAG: 2-amino-4-hydroxy-6-hydroxymethyldihydropteridine diphosphokinase, partial [Gammaproteobacteria bacterium]|nr:2-amino-4-hydroxy-6-hydroxymethyldihydropteridine diphosphokinase [Gammaproteobacteria bacterium]